MCFSTSQYFDEIKSRETKAGWDWNQLILTGFSLKNGVDAWSLRLPAGEESPNTAGHGGS